MNKKLCTWFVFIFLVCMLSAIDVTGNQSGAWTIANSPYNVTGDITVPIGTTLTLEPGVHVQFSGFYSMNVQGTIVAVGTLADSILFTASAGNAAGWKGIQFNNNTSLTNSQFNYCVFEKGKTGATSVQGAAIYVKNFNRLIVTNCNFRKNTANTGGAIYLDHANITVSNSVFNANTSLGAGGAVHMTQSSPVFTNCIFSYNQSTLDGGAVNSFNQSNPKFIKSLFYNNHSLAFGGAIAIFASCTDTLEKVTISRNTANSDGSAISCQGTSNLTISNSIVYFDNGNEIKKSADSQIIARYSDLEVPNTEPYFSSTCINVDPLFVDMYSNNYHLILQTLPTPLISPCVDAGNPAVIYNDPDNTVADMGALYAVQRGIKGTVSLNGGVGVLTNVVVKIVDPSDNNSIIAQTHPDANGNYFFSIANGNYVLVATLAGYSAYVSELISVSNNVIIKNITLIAGVNGQIKGKVAINGGTGNIAQSVVTANPGNYSTNPVGIDSNGDDVVDYYQYTLSVPEGVYTVTATLAGYHDITVDSIYAYQSQITDNVDLTLALATLTGNISGQITLLAADGTAYVNPELIYPTITITCENQSVHPNAAGHYTLSNVSTGPRQVVATCTNFTTVTLDSVVVNQEQTTLNQNLTMVNWTVMQGTDQNMTIFATVTRNGAFDVKKNSDQFAAFIGNTCVGLGTWVAGNPPMWDEFYKYDLSGYWYITVVSNDQNAIVDFKFFDSKEGNVVYDLSPSLLFNNNAVNLVNFYAPSDLDTLQYALAAGWNWISYNLELSNTSLNSVFNPITSTIQSGEQVRLSAQSKSAVFYSDLGWVGGEITNINNYEGYLLQIPSLFHGYEVVGTRINPILRPYKLYTHGYKWISYLPYANIDIKAALIDLVADTVIVRSQSHSAVRIAGNWVGDLTQMTPGSLYKIEIHMADDSTYFSYPITTNTNTRSEKSENIETYWTPITGNSDNMILIATFENMNDNYEIGLFDEKGNCHSVGSYLNGMWYFTVLGNESEINLVPRFYNKLNNQVTSSYDVITYEPNGFVGSFDKPITFKGTQGSNTVSKVSVLNNYPNPFNPTTSFHYAIPQDGHVKLSVYNVRGQVVKTLVNGMQKAQDYNITWNANGQASGIYFYKLEYKGNTITRKCVLLK